MNAEKSNTRITGATLFTLFKSLFVGFVIGQVWLLALIVGCRLSELFEAELASVSVFAILFLASAYVFVYLYIRELPALVLKLLISKRFDIFLICLIGIVSSSTFTKLANDYYQEATDHLSAPQLLFIALLPFIILTALAIQALILQWVKRDEVPSFFISDTEKSSKDDDLLGFNQAAVRFAERIYNGGSAESMVFGIDAPWGIGKSTFINLCIQSLEEKYYDDIIIYKFNPLRYEGKTDLLEHFVDGLIRSIQKNAFIPEIRPLASRYSKFINAKASASKYGFALDAIQSSYTAEDALNDLEVGLEQLNKKVIVVIDDLDRLSFPAIKDILFAVKKSFTLRNISYVLCYDTENLISAKGNANEIQHVVEFLEKFINVKISLFLDSEALIKCIGENFDRVLADNPQLDPIAVGKITGALRQIYKSPEFYNYQPLLGDLRKLKRLINTIVLFEIEKTDFENSDIDKIDLIHLLLVYINYPRIFRKIYDTETNGRRGFFSLIVPHEFGYPDAPRSGPERSGAPDDEYRNSKLYLDYIEKLDPTQQFLLNKIFLARERLQNSTQINRVGPEIKGSLACFNGDGMSSGGHNLEQYLNLIVRVAKPKKQSQFKFYFNMKDRLLQGESIDKIFTEPEFSFTRSESSHQQFWRIVVSSIRDVDSKVADHVIRYLVNHISDYSLYTNNQLELGLRDDILYYLGKILDSAGWIDPDGEFRNNTDENVLQIASWLFGEDEHLNDSIIAKLGDSNRGLCGLYDLMTFRLLCSADRNGDLYNLTRALSKHGNPLAPTTGPTTQIAIEEMREISQRVFLIFKERFILRNINFFDELNTISFKELSGKYNDFVKTKIQEGALEEAEIETAVMEWRSRIAGFVLYQLANSLVNLGVGCGYYDESGTKDEMGIANRMNDYLFDFCFNPERNSNAYKYFLYYLLINFSPTFPTGRGRAYRPTIGEFTKILQGKRLSDYWRENRGNIIKLEIAGSHEIIYTGTYHTTYADETSELFNLLDQFIGFKPQLG